MKGGGKVTVQWGILTNTHLANLMWLTAAALSCVELYPGHDGMGKAPPQVAFLPGTHSSRLTIRRTPGKSILRDIQQNT